MGWNEARSEERVKQNDFGDFNVEVKDLRRTMDFRKLEAKDVRRAQGVHLYIDVPNFHEAVSAARNDKEKQKKLVRAASVLRKIQRDLMETDDVGDVQRQTVRLHALVYKPYDSDEDVMDADRAKSAVIHAITQNTYVIDVFGEVFTEAEFGSAAGLSGGTSYIANIGRHGNRELISLGSCANLAAKILSASDTITITKELYELLPEFLAEYFKKSSIVAGVQTYQAVELRWSTQPQLCADLGVKWNTAYWIEKTENYRDELPLEEIEISEANVLIDLESLTESKCKRVSAVTFYADLDGFTRYVQEAEDNDSVVSLVRQLHMIRAELHAVVASDYEGLVLQHRGDCILGILHVPCGRDTHTIRCNKAVEIAIGLQSSMEYVLNKHLAGRTDIHVAIGLDVGKALVTRLGKKGQRVGICFGPEVTNAETLQRGTKGKAIRISTKIYDELEDEDIRSQFEDDGDSYVAKSLTFPKLDHIKEERAVRNDTLRATATKGSVIVTTTKPDQPGVWRNSSPWRSR